MTTSSVAVSRLDSGPGSFSSSTSESEDEAAGDRRKMRSAIVEIPQGTQQHVVAPSPEPSPSPRRASSPHRVSPPRYRERRRRHRTPSSSEEKEPTPPPKRKRPEPDPITMRTGGAYIPPARLRMMQEGITDKNSVAYQRIAWEALKKSINGLVNKVNVSNIANILQEMFQENVVRGRGLVARSVIQAQAASPMFSHVYAALVAIINTKFPQTGELIAKRLIVRFRRAFRRNDKPVCIATVKFLAHLVNQQVLHELVALELLTLLLEDPSDDSVEVAVGFIKECGVKLKELTPKGLYAVFETLRSILHSGKIASRVQYMIEVLFAIRKDGFKDYMPVVKELDLVSEDDQITHLLSLTDEELDPEDKLNVFQHDPEYQENEEKYRLIKEEILGEDADTGSSEGEGDSEEDSSEEESDEDEGGGNKMEISDLTGDKERAIRRQIYLTIMSSLDYEECAHKLLKTMGEGNEKEIALMLVECCSQERSYLRFYGLLGQRLCLLNQAWVGVFNEGFQDQYATVHRLETNKLRNVAKFFGQLFYVDALPWTSMECIHLNEEETNSSSRIFVKILFQELAEFMGLPKLNTKLRDPMLAPGFEGLMPRDNPQNTRFAINFFTSIGLGGLTDDLREHLKNAQKLANSKQATAASSSSSPSSSSSSSESESSSEDDSSSSSEASVKVSSSRRKRSPQRKEKRGDRGEESRKEGRREESRREREGESRREEREGDSRRKEREGGSKRKEREGGSKRKEREGGSKRKEREGGSKRKEREGSGESRREERDGDSRRKEREGGSRRKEREGESRREGEGGSRREREGDSRKKKREGESRRDREGESERKDGESRRKEGKERGSQREESGRREHREDRGRERGN